MFSFNNTVEKKDFLDRYTRMSTADDHVATKLSFHSDSNKERNVAFSSTPGLEDLVDGDDIVSRHNLINLSFVHCWDKLSSKYF